MCEYVPSSVGNGYGYNLRRHNSRYSFDARIDSISTSRGASFAWKRVTRGARYERALG